MPLEQERHGGCRCTSRPLGAEGVGELDDRQPGLSSGAGGDERTESGDDRRPKRLVTFANAGDRAADVVHLRVGDSVGDRRDRAVVEHLAVGTDHARDPLAGELA